MITLQNYIDNWWKKEGWSKKVFYILYYNLDFKWRKPIAEDFILETSIKKLGVLSWKNVEKVNWDLPYYFQCEWEFGKKYWPCRTQTAIWLNKDELINSDLIKRKIEGFLPLVVEKKTKQIEYCKQKIQENKKFITEYESDLALIYDIIYKN